MDIKVEIKDAKKEFFKLRARFNKLQRVAVGEALLESSEPIVAAAQANAPTRSGLLRGRIAPTMIRQRGQPVVLVGPARLSRGDKRFPFYGLFQEKGWHATGRATRKTAKSPRFIPGKRFLQRGGEQGFQAAERIFARRVTENFAAIQSAGEAAGIV